MSKRAPKRNLSAEVNHLRICRVQHGMTMRELAELSGVHVNTIMRYEQGLVSPSVETARKICKVLGVTMDDVFGE